MRPGRASLSPLPQPLGRVECREGGKTEVDVEEEARDKSGLNGPATGADGPAGAGNEHSGQSGFPGSVPAGEHVISLPDMSVSHRPDLALETPPDVEFHDRSADGVQDALKRMQASIQDMLAREDSLTQRLTAMRDSLRKAEREGLELRERLDGAVGAGSADSTGLQVNPGSTGPGKQ